MKEKAKNENYKIISEKNIQIGKKIKFLKEESLLREKKAEMNSFLQDLIDQDETQSQTKKDEYKFDLSTFLNTTPNQLKVPEYLTCMISFVMIQIYSKYNSHKGSD